MDTEVYGIFFLLVLLSLLGCGIGYACISCYACMKRRVIQNDADRRNLSLSPECRHQQRNANLTTNVGNSNRRVPPTSRTRPNTMARSSETAPLHTVVPITNWPLNQPWPMQNSNNVSSAPQTHCYTSSVPVSELLEIAESLGIPPADFMPQETYLSSYRRTHRNIADNDLPPSYEEAMGANAAEEILKVEQNTPSGESEL